MREPPDPRLENQSRPDAPLGYQAGLDQRRDPADVVCVDGLGRRLIPPPAGGRQRGYAG